MSNIWAQSLQGKRIDLVEPAADLVDFDEIAVTLSHTVRYAGNAQKPINVAQHTLLVCEAGPQELLPWLALHDAHEAYIGDITTPTAKAIAHFAGRIRHGGDIAVRDAIAHLKEMHDIAIHSAAGLPMPTAEQRVAIRKADLIALATERRDFLNTCAHRWDEAVEQTRPLPRVHRLKSPGESALRLGGLFHSILPALKAARHRHAG
jgi:hypothetical protein